MSRIHLLTAACSLTAALTVSAAPLAWATQTLAVYKLSEKATHCPKNMHAKYGCVKLTGKTMTASRWPEMHRIAAVGAAAPGIHTGCVSAITTGTLSGPHGVVHFTGAGYYCPKSDTAAYRLRFNAADAKRFGLPLYGAIHYHGKENSETFTASKGRRNRPEPM